MGLACKEHVVGETGSGKTTQIPLVNLAAVDLNIPVHCGLFIDTSIYGLFKGLRPSQINFLFGVKVISKKE